MNWIPLESVDQVQQIIERSKEVPCVIFKHSTRCSISSMAKFRLEGDWDISESKLEAYYLDLIAHRNISDYISEELSVYHESPQVILLKDGEVVYDESNLDITIDDLKESLPV
jgi:bacillithiol system protein YtxJ